MTTGKLYEFSAKLSEQGRGEGSAGQPTCQRRFSLGQL
jgi:hypothetical protein